MKKLMIGIVLAALVIGVLFLVFGTSTPTAQGSLLKGADFLAAYKSTPEAVLLDVRTPGEFNEGHLEGAMNIDFESNSFIGDIQKQDKEKPYFVYCRSGNRSGQAVAIFKKEGFKNVSELKGGIISNQSALQLVTTSSSPEYVVDESDMVNGTALVADIASSKLKEGEIKGLIQMREEEKLAHDVYTTLGTQWGAMVFSNIASSEQTHTEAVKVLLDRYAIEDPVTDNTVGVFKDAAMQKLYTDLVAKGSKSLTEALIVGATIEDLDIRDLDTLIAQTDKQDILVTYANLQKGSRNHMRAFVKNLSRYNATYTPQYISNDAYTAIINAQQERGRKW